ncbi:MAG TPA: hypothetical protein VGF84_20665 [Micromonosporaceae bacterium]
MLLPDRTDGRPPQIRGRISMRGAEIAGQLRIEGVRIEADGDAFSLGRITVGDTVTIDTTSVVGRIDLSAGDIGGFVIGADCSVDAPGRTAIDLSNAQSHGHVVIAAGTPIRGTVNVGGARIRGLLTLTGVVLQDPDGASVFRASGATIDGDVDLQNVTATGQLNFWRTTMNGSLLAGGARLTHPDGVTIRLYQATVHGSVFLTDGFSSEGVVLMNRTVIDGHLNCTDGTFRCPGPSRLNENGHAILAQSTQVLGQMMLSWRTVSPSVDFTDASTAVLTDDPATWPSRFSVAGFQYSRFGAATWDWRARRDWLAGQTPFDAGPYEQAARVFRQHGYGLGAEQLLIAQRVQARHAAYPSGRHSRALLDAAYGWSVGYGYRVAGRCSVLQGGGEGPGWEGRQARAVPYTGRFCCSMY